ncbi:PrgI family protein [Kitasatospora sp. LaBMicrA B282]|uniref:PrgI family protein n=1 Tax=Kitasatospora sp. LaBMicrA B282 TaxID=3420949 RepID=UPI003D0F6DD4
MINRLDGDEPWTSLVKIPADVDKDDAVLGPLTARQAVHLGAVVAVLWLGYQVSKHLVPPLLFAAMALPVGTAATLAVLARHDGLPFDRWLLAAWRHHRAPRHLTPTGGRTTAGVLPWQHEVTQHHQVPERIGRLALPLADVREDGLLELGPAGSAALSEASTVNLALRTGGEQQVLIAAFGRWLNALSGPVQILLRTRLLELGRTVSALRQVAPALPHPLLEQACLDHADFLAALTHQHELLQRQVLIVHREPGLDRGADARAVRRREESAALLAAADVPAQPLTGRAAFAVLASACDPDAPQHPDPALPHTPVTTATAFGEVW